MTNFEKLKEKVNGENTVFKSNMLQSPSVEIFDAAQKIRDYAHISRVLLSEGLWDEEICGVLCSRSNLVKTIDDELFSEYLLTDENISDCIFNFVVDIRRDRQERDKELWHRIAVDFMRLALDEGYKVTPIQNSMIYANITLPCGTNVPFDRNNHLYFEKGMSDQRLVNLMHDVKSYVFAVEHWAADMPADSPAKGHKQLCDFGSTLLTAKFDPKSGWYQFSTWNYGLDKNTLHGRRDFFD